MSVLCERGRCQEGLVSLLALLLVVPCNKPTALSSNVLYLPCWWRL